jgi:disulfide oxidoreductase YuzD
MLTSEILEFVLDLINTLPASGATPNWFQKRIKEKYYDNQEAISLISKHLDGISDQSTPYITMVKNDPYSIATIPMLEKSREICLIAAKNRGVSSISQIPKEHIDAEMCEALVKGRSELILKIPNEFITEKMVLMISKRTGSLDLFKHLPSKFQTDKILHSIIKKSTHVDILLITQHIPRQFWSTALKILAKIKPHKIISVSNISIDNQTTKFSWRWDAGISLLSQELVDEILSVMASNVSNQTTLMSWLVQNGKFCTDMAIKNSIEKHQKYIIHILNDAIGVPMISSKITQEHYNLAVKSKYKEVEFVPKRFQTFEMCTKAYQEGVHHSKLLNEEFRKTLAFN